MKLDVRLYKPESGAWIAEIPAIPGCGSDGTSLEEALQDVQDAARLCLEVRKDLRLPLIVSYSGQAVTVCRNT